MMRTGRVLLMAACCWVQPLLAASSGDVIAQESATACMDVGIRANLSGLNDISMTALGTDGSAGAEYQGSDQFSLETNAPVRILVSGNNLSNGVTSLPTAYSIDGQADSFDTPGGGTHKGSHTLLVRTQLSNVSAQQAGNYSAPIVLTVLPQVSGMSRCETPGATGGTSSFEVESGSTVELQLQVSETTESSLVQDTGVEIPAAFRWALDSPAGIRLFPYLGEYLAWERGEITELSEEAKYWWLFPINTGILQQPDN